MDAAGTARPLVVSQDQNQVWDIENSPIHVHQPQRTCIYQQVVDQGTHTSAF